MAYLCADKRGEFIADEHPSRAWDEWPDGEMSMGKVAPLSNYPKELSRNSLGTRDTWEDDLSTPKEFKVELCLLEIVR